jgi:protein SCO1/2
VVAALSLVAGCGASPVPPPPDSVGTPLDHPLPASIERLPLVDSAGHRTDLAAYRGKVVVLSDMMTLCQESCPLDTANIVATARQVQRAGLADKVEFLSVTIDPARDSAARLAAYRALFAPAPADWAVLGGSIADLARLWRYLGLYYQRAPEDSPPARDWLTGKPLTYDISHADLVYFFGTDGAERFTMDGTAHVASADQLPGTLRRFLSATGRQNLAHPGFGSWTVEQALQAIGWLTGRPISIPAPGGGESRTSG